MVYKGTGYWVLYLRTNTITSRLNFIRVYVYDSLTS